MDGMYLVKRYEKSYVFLTMTCKFGMDRQWNFFILIYKSFIKMYFTQVMWFTLFNMDDVTYMLQYRGGHTTSPIGSMDCYLCDNK